MSRATKRITFLRNDLNSIKEKNEKMKELNIGALLKNNNIPQCQSDFIHEFFKAAKVKKP